MRGRNSIILNLYRSTISKICRFGRFSKCFSSMSCSWNDKSTPCLPCTAGFLLFNNPLRRIDHISRFCYNPFRFTFLNQIYSYSSISINRQNSNHPSLQQWRCMAGHAKWQNVAHTKQAKDRERAAKITKFVRLVRSAVREGGPDPKYNTSLRNALEEARKCSVPLSSLEGSMKKASSGKIKCGILEIPGPGGIHVIVEYESDNVGTLRHAVKGIIRKYMTAILSTEGRWRSAYDQKGIVAVVGKNDDTELNAEQALDSAIEAGAEDVQLKMEEERKILEFICDPSDLLSVKKELEEMGYRIEEAYIAYIPRVLLKLSPEAAAASEQLLSELQDVNDVVRVYDNMQ